MLLRAESCCYCLLRVGRESDFGKLNVGMLSSNTVIKINISSLHTFRWGKKILILKDNTKYRDYREKKSNLKTF